MLIAKTASSIMEDINVLSTIILKLAKEDIEDIAFLFKMHLL